MDHSADVRLLLVEDNPDDARFVQRLLLDSRGAPGGRDRRVEIASVEHVERLADGLDRLPDADAVLLDLELPDSSGIETVETVVEHAPSMPVVVLTGRTDVGVEAIQRGAQDYLVKGMLTNELLVRTIRYAMQRAQVTSELRDRNHRLALANELIRTDLRNDVSVIVGLSDQLRDRVDPEDRPTVESLLEASQHVLELTDTAAELIDVLAREPTVGREPRNLRCVLEEALERFRRDSDAELDVEWQVPEDEPVIVYGSPMLGSALGQLLSNAATHTDRDTPRIAVTTEVTDERASVSIADDGIGISDAQKERIVDPDLGLADRVAMGTGLYFVRSVLEQIGGELAIEDNVPRGTVVTVTLERA